MVRIKVSIAHTFWQKIKGLIGEKQVKPLLLQTRFGIHTFGVQLPIDILVLDKENRVVKCKVGLKPNRVFFWNPKHKRIIELASGFLDKNHIHIGDTIALRD